MLLLLLSTPFLNELFLSLKYLELVFFVSTIIKEEAQRNYLVY